MTVPPHRVELLIKHGGPLEGVDLDDRDKLYDLMEEPRNRDFDRFKGLTTERLKI